MGIEFRNHELSYLEEALQLAMKEYNAECVVNSQLPKEGHRNLLKEELTGLFQLPYGKMAFEDGKLIGYLSFYGPFEGHCGKTKGVFSPFGGNAFAGKEREKLASLLFEKVSIDLTNDEVGSISISRPANNEEVNRVFSLSSFGIRCADAIVRLSERKKTEMSQSKVLFKELKQEDKEKVRVLQEKLQLHLCSAPVYFPPLLSYIDEWLSDTDIRVFAAMDGDRAVGFISITDEAENYVTRAKNMVNICGTYVEPAYRKDHCAAQLLEYVCQTCEKEGYVYLGVDCETMNPTALRFWGKYFQNYTYSYVRRIDERCFGYLDYLKKNFYPHEEY